MDRALHVQIRAHHPVAINASLHCDMGQIVALCGPSGSGKSTLLKAIAGLVTGPDMTGTIHCGEQQWLNTSTGQHQATRDRDIGFVFQHYALFPHYSALNNVLLGQKINSINALQRQQAMALMDRLGLGGLQHRLPRELSGGQQQRVALARALFKKPKVLLLDEPFSAVDTATRQRLYRELALIRQQGDCAIILVTHDLSEARQLADQVVVIDQGETLQAGTPEAVFSRPRNAQVAHLVGITNLFKGHFKKSASPHPNASFNVPAVAHLNWVCDNNSTGHTGTPVVLSVTDKGKIPHDTPVNWVIAGEFLDVKPWPRDSNNLPQPSGFNTHPFVLSHVSRLGEICLCTLHTADGKLGPLQVNLPTSALKQWRTEVGQLVAVTLAPQGIHIMPIKP